MKKAVYIAGFKRTPFGGFGGSLSPFLATQLGAMAIEELIKATKIDKEQVDEVYMGNVLSANLGQAPARQAAKFAGLPDKVEATTINKVCSSGLKSVTIGALSILNGDAEVVIAGGMESMSNCPFYSDKSRFGQKFGHYTMVDGMLRDGLWDVYHDFHMGSAAELCNKRYEISREEQDEFTVFSYRRALEATEKGWLTNQLVPVQLKDRKGNVVEFNKDEDVFKVDFDKIPTLKPVFEKDGSITAASASNLNDGGAAMLLVSEEKLKELDLKPMARIVSFADAAQAPEWFTTSPTLAIQKLLAKAGKSKQEVDFFEVNEAYANVVLANSRLLNIPTDKINVWGGAVAYGHPIGVSGNRILGNLVNILIHHNVKNGVAAICNGGGGASSIFIEKV